MDLTAELTTVRSELARADTKAATLLGLAGTAATVAAGLTVLGIQHLPLPAQVFAWTAVVLLGGAVALLLIAVCPAVPRPGRGCGWMAYTHTTPARLRDRTPAEYAADQDAELETLARLARGKYRAIRDAVYLLMAALAVGGAALTAVATGGA
jgi:hypothetical protein